MSVGKRIRSSPATAKLERPVLYHGNPCKVTRTLVASDSTCLRTYLSIVGRPHGDSSGIWLNTSSDIAHSDVAIWFLRDVRSTNTFHQSYVVCERWQCSSLLSNVGCRRWAVYHDTNCLPLQAMLEKLDSYILCAHFRTVFVWPFVVPHSSPTVLFANHFPSCVGDVCENKYLRFFYMERHPLC